MPTVDFGTVRAFVDAGAVEVAFPRGYDELKTALKEMKARWMPQRFCWRVETRWARIPENEIVRRIEDILRKKAPPGWQAAVEKFGAFACSTRRFEVKVGWGGIRIMLPPGHPSHYALKQVDNGKQDKETWLLPAASCTSSVVRPVLERVVKEDRDLFISYVEHLEGRTIRGIVPISPPEGDAMDLIAGKFVYADHAFLKVADPHVKNGPVHAWPFKVLERRDLESGLEIRLSYLEPDLAYRAVRYRQGRPEEERKQNLDLVHATEKWTYKRA